jgi:hypothetical protein
MAERLSVTPEQTEAFRNLRAKRSNESPSSNEPDPSPTVPRRSAARANSPLNSLCEVALQHQAQRAVRAHLNGERGDVIEKRSRR